MKHIMLAAAAALAVGATTVAHAQSEPSSFSANSSGAASGVADAHAMSDGASLAALLAEWDRAGFVAPSKPGQFRVYGRNGYVTNGPGYNAMVALIRGAVSAAQEGRDRDAAMKIADARSLLAASKPA